MADSIGIVELLNRASGVFTLAGNLGRAFQEQMTERIIFYDPTIWDRHAATFDEFWQSLLALRETIQSPPHGFVAVADQLKKAATIARDIRGALDKTGTRPFTAYTEFFPDLNSIWQDGFEAISNARKAMRLDDPFAFLDDPSGVFDTEVVDINWPVLLPFLKWSDNGRGVPFGLDESGAWGFQCNDGSVIALGSDPRLKDYENHLHDEFRKSTETSRAVAKVAYEAIANPNDPEPFPMSLVQKRPEFIRWLSGDNPRYAPSHAEYAVLYPAYAERIRRIRERSIVSPHSRNTTRSFLEEQDTPSANASDDGWSPHLPEELRGVPLVNLCLTTAPPITEHLARTRDGRFHIIWWDSQRSSYRWSTVSEDFARDQAEPVRKHFGLASWHELFNSAESEVHRVAKGEETSGASLADLVGRTIRRLQAKPDLLRGYIWDHPDTLNVKATNAAAAELDLGPVFGVGKAPDWAHAQNLPSDHSANQSNVECLTVYHPDGSEYQIHRSGGLLDDWSILPVTETIARLEAWGRKAAELIQPNQGSRERILQRLGEMHLKELQEEKTAIEQPHPDELALKEWLKSDLVRGKFGAWWHSRIAVAKDLRISISSVWDALASLFDRLFPGTCNVFNLFEPRPHVTERKLYAYLESKHALSAQEVNDMTLVALAQVLQRDVEIAGSSQLIPLGNARSTPSPHSDASTHSPDFRSVNWFGSKYDFTATQAACVKFLWENWGQGTPTVGEQTILEHAESAGSRLRDVFNKGKHPAWNNMIKSAGKGAFCLVEPRES